ncbi:hypothetical protein KC973_02295 [Candidatus Saccharibacteria bacterium]|nr:hypothetical protein [Candidatus Saccharibacteria bacterium]
MKFNQTLEQFMLANVWSGGGWLFLWLIIGFIGSIVIVMLDEDWKKTSNIVVSVLLLIATVASIVSFTKVNWDNDKDEARYYTRSMTFVVPDLDETPATVRYLLKGATESSREGCDMVDASDMHTCIVEGDFSPEGWEPRVGSLDGAIYAIKRTSGDQQRISLNEEMMAYLNEWEGQPARWSGVLDGTGKEQPLGGVSEWDGSSETTDCKFEDKYALDRAFGGERGNSLPNLLAERFPALRYSQSDVWGYCDGDEPIVVVPTTKQIQFKGRTVDTAGGLIIVRGEDGQTKLTHVSNAKAGDYPGPVYPMSLVERQRETSKWAAGRKNEDRRSFGFEPATSEAQAGNTSEYLLKNKTTGRLEWVTPLTLRKSTSELFVAYAITPADVVDDGNLNQLSLYILAEDDPRRVNIDNLEADALDYLAKNAGTFISNGGKLVEFTPVDGDIWRAFGELKGRVVYRLEISAGDNITPKLVSVGPTGNDNEQSGEGNDTEFCGQNPSDLTPNQLVNCIQVMADELDQRQQPSSED